MRERRGRTPEGRGGFTLVELVVTVLIVGILAGIMVPNLQEALMKAQVAHIASDAQTISQAAYQYVSDHGSFPTSQTQLTPYLPESFEFSYKGVTYMWIGVGLPSADNIWQSRSIGLLIFFYPARPELQTAMKALQGPNTYWSSALVYTIYAG